MARITMQTQQFQTPGNMQQKEGLESNYLTKRSTTIGLTFLYN